MTVPQANRVLSKLFDIRNIIGTLLAIYGVVLTIAGFAPAVLREHSDPAAAGNRSDLYIGTDANWWVGLIMLAVAAGFIVWALVRPLRGEDVATTDNPE
jgi:H+/Cl- antiporter ClcA